jgi:PAS domain S-box-containing protein
MVVWSGDMVTISVSRSSDTIERPEFYRALVDQAPDIITVVAKDGTISFESQAIQRVLGYTPDELIGTNVFERVHPEDLDHVRASFEEAAETGESPLTEFRFRHKDGSWRVLESVGRRCGDAGSNTATGVAYSRDVTERKRLEEQYRHTQKLETIGRMTSAIAHDFNNLLTAIHGHAHIVLESADSEPLRAGIQQILAAAERATLFSQQLLQYARRNDGTDVAVESTVDVHDALADLSAMLKPLVGKRSRLTLALGAATVRVPLDRGALGQIVMNLAVNAHDAMPAGGVLTISTRNCSRRKARGGSIEYLVLEVSDNGVGMSPEVRKRVFEPFFTTKGPGKGTGLGLSTVFDLVARAKGQVELDSIEGQGTTFRVLLPVVEA